MSVKTQFARFAVVGAIGFCVDVAVLYLCLRGFGLGVYSARLVSYLAAATATWYLNRRITFVGFERNKPLRQWFRFVLVNGFGGLVNYGVYGVIVTFGAALAYAPFLRGCSGLDSGSCAQFCRVQNLRVPSEHLSQRSGAHPFPGPRQDWRLRMDAPPPMSAPLSGHKILFHSPTSS